MFRYHQKQDTSTWRLGVDEHPPLPWAFSMEKEAARVTILTVSEDVEFSDETNLKYAGPLYFDIDFIREEIAKAIASGVELCEKLMSLGVNEASIEIHLSGSKGVHIFVDQRVFSGGRPVKSLAKIYLRMAVELYVPGLDMAVYSGGKGRMFRPPNAKRPDGVYKVPVTFQELRSLTAEDYLEWIKTPRPCPIVVPQEGKAARLSHLYTACKKNIEAVPQSHTVISQETLKLLKGEVPLCIEALCEGKEKSATTFNTAAINVACWSSRAGVETARYSSVFSRVAEACTSKKYGTVLQRTRHIQGLHAYIAGNEKYSFSCAGMLSVITARPCGACPMKGQGEAKDLSQDDADYDRMYVYSHRGQYYADPEYNRVIGSFLMDINSLIYSETEKGKIEATSITVRTPITGQSHTISNFSEEAWTSKQKLKQELVGLEGVAFFGTDIDVSKLRLTITKQDIDKEQEVYSQHKLSKIGVTYYRRLGPKDARSPEHTGNAVYVERDHSVDTLTFIDTHILTGTVKGVPQLKTKDWNIPITDEANEAFSLLLKTNKPLVISSLLGWMFASHVKSHARQLSAQFPMLYIAGISGTGKNCLIAIWMRLAGLEGEEARTTIEAPNSTKLPFQQGLSTSSTIPRVINEFNPKSMSDSHYSAIVEILKGVWDEQSVNKGRIGGGDRSGSGPNVSVVEWTLSAPVVTLSEEPITTPALMHRGIKIQLDPDGHAEGSEAFYKLEHKADDLVGISVWLIKRALKTTVLELHDMFIANQLPPEVLESSIPDRLKYSYQLLLACYDWAIEALSVPDCGFSLENLQSVKDMKKVLVDYVYLSKDEIVKNSAISEPSRVLKDIALLALNSGDPSTRYRIDLGVHFAVTTDGLLYLDMTVIYQILQQFKRASGLALSIRDEESFITSCRGISYFLSGAAHKSDLLPKTKGRTVCVFDIEALMDAGVPASMFLPD